MAEHLTREELGRYLNKTLAPEDLSSTASHLSRCDPCRQRLFEAGRNLEARLFATPRHLDYDDLRGYIKRSLNGVERDWVEHHVARCPSCAAELTDLQRFDAQLVRVPNHDSVRTWRERITQVFRVPNLHIRWATVAAVGLCVAVVLLLPHRGVRSSTALQLYRVGSHANSFLATLFFLGTLFAAGIALARWSRKK
jgi:hypothetical protein